MIKIECEIEDGAGKARNIEILLIAKRSENL